MTSYYNYYSDYFSHGLTTSGLTTSMYRLFPTQPTTGTISTCTDTCSDSTYYLPGNHNCTYYQDPKIIIQTKDPELTEQELLKIKEKRTEAKVAAEKARREKEDAEKKARELLLECLDIENVKKLKNKEPLEVSSKLFGDIKYQIPVSNGRIKALKDGKIISELCLSVKESGCWPMDDIVLTKLLYVTHDEENMIRVANHYNVNENLLARLN